MKPFPLAQRVSVQARFLRRIVRVYLRSDEIRWRMLVTTSRFTSHIAIISVALIAVLLAGSHLASSEATRAQNNATASIVKSVTTSQSSTSGGRIYSPASLQSYLSLINQDGGLLARRAVADTVVPVESRNGMITYTVQSGDTIETIAARYRLLPTTLVWSNKEVEEAPDRLSIGQILVILPVDGIYHMVEADDNITSTAEKFKAKPEDIISQPLNNLTSSSNLLPGTYVIVPSGVKPFVARAVEASGSGGGAYTGPAVSSAGSGAFQWPASGVLTQYFWWGHPALDIASAVGVPIAASDGGYVAYAGWDGSGYGYMVILDHGNGFQTLYAHLSQYYVDPGQAVARGQLIAAMGNTGRSTGPHLHFEIRYGGVQQNPLFYLP